MPLVVNLLLVPILPSAFCGAMSVGRRTGIWLAISWVITIAIDVMILFSLFPTQTEFAQLDIIEIGKIVGATLATSVYWLVSGVTIFFVVRRLWAGRNAGGKG